jgi:outer membrane protein TolC
MIRISIAAIVLSGFIFIRASAQGDSITLTLEKAMLIANDSSLQAFRSKNLYMSKYWGFKNYQASKLPSVSLSTTPVSYDRSITSQFDDSTYIYIPSETFSSNGGLSISQNLPLTGGSMYLRSNLTRFENILPKSNINYVATWFTLGYSQPIFSFNNFKWLRKTEPIKFEIAKKEYVQSREEINLTVLGYFFNLAMAEMEINIARSNYATADTLYKIGQQRYLLASIDKGDLLVLKLEWVNAQNNLIRTESDYSMYRDALVTYLRIDNSLYPEIVLPEKLPDFQVDPLMALELAKNNNPFYMDLEYKALEADKQVESTYRASRFNASIDASIGFNQNGDRLPEAYRNPSGQQHLAATIVIPILDWGERKSRYYIACNDRDALMISNEQEKQKYEQEIVRLIKDFNLQSKIVESSKEASVIAEESYDIYKQRFIMGSIDINTLVLQQNKKDNALKSYVSELNKYWNYFYSIRKLTMYDFTRDKSLEELFGKELFEN